MAALHLIKLCVGCDTVEELIDWRASHVSQDWILRTRQTPQRGAELMAGGSLFRVFKGRILSRQEILNVRTAGEGPARHCEITLAETVIRTIPTPRRAFQGWRYLAANDAPADLNASVGFADAPVELVSRLRELGAW
jgi:hypothetical protein